MNEYLLIIHRDLINKESAPSPQQMQDLIKPFQEWIGGIAAQNKLVAPPKRLDTSGRVVKGNVVTDGPYAEVKESVGGLIIVRANSYEEASDIAKGCPILNWGASVEIRQAIPNA
ncbi:YciI family protein [Chryseolinea sp. T2]|uniref:YciI family protein n=1 Tax=Chryseolinea sp. T2 TaxID=3129255 RepID=UPI0030783F5C